MRITAIAVWLHAIWPSIPPFSTHLCSRLCAGLAGRDDRGNVGSRLDDGAQLSAILPSTPDPAANSCDEIGDTDADGPILHPARARRLAASRRYSAIEPAAEKLLRIIEGTRTPGAGVPAVNKFIRDMLPLTFTCGDIYTNKPLALAVTATPGFGPRVVLAAVQAGHVSRFRDLAGAGATGRWLLRDAVSVGQVAMIAEIVAVPAMDVSDAALQVKRLCTDSHDGLTASQIQCFQELLAQPRVVAALSQMRPGDVACAAAVACRTDPLPITRQGAGRGWSWEWQAWQVAEGCGHIKVLQYHHTESFKLASPAALFLDMNRCPTEDYWSVGSLAARFGHVDTLEWLYAHGYLRTRDSVGQQRLEFRDQQLKAVRDPRAYPFRSQPNDLWTNAGSSGDWGVIELLYGYFSTGDDDDTASDVDNDDGDDDDGDNDDGDVIYSVAGLDTMSNEHLLIGVAESGDLEMLAELLDMGCPGAHRAPRCHSRVLAGVDAASPGRSR